MKQLSVLEDNHLTSLIKLKQIDKLLYCEDLEIYLRYCQLFYSNLADRTSTVEMPLNFKIHSPILPLKSNIQTYADAVDSKACEILEIAEKNDYKIYIMWSGGPDSTSILSSLLLNSTTAQKERFIVLLSQGSIKEHPNFFNRFILGKIKYQSSFQQLKKIQFDQALLIHGECNDQLFGRPAILNVIPFKDNIADKTVFNKLYKSNYKNEQMDEMWYDIYRMTSNSVGVELKTVGDFAWWTDFCFCFQYILLRIFYRSGDLPHFSKINDKFICFFDSDKFNQWSMQNMPGRQYNKLEYKKEVKEYILQFDNDLHYFETKTKIVSGVSIVSGINLKHILDDSMEDVDPTDLMAYYNPNSIFKKYI